MVSVSVMLGAETIFVERHFIEGTRSTPKVSPAIMKVISLAESSGKPNTIAFLATPIQAEAANTLLSRHGIRYRVRPYDASRYSFGVWPERHQARLVFSILKSTGIQSYDVGLVQVNSLNAKRNGWDEERLLNDLVYNVEKGAKIMDGCIRGNSNLERSIECYNKGLHKVYSYTYYERFFALAKK